MKSWCCVFRINRPKESNRNYYSSIRWLYIINAKPSEIGFVSGVSSNLQTQLNNKQVKECYPTTSLEFSTLQPFGTYQLSTDATLILFAISSGTALYPPLGIKYFSISSVINQLVLIFCHKTLYRIHVCLFHLVFYYINQKKVCSYLWCFKIFISFSCNKHWDG